MKAGWTCANDECPVIKANKKSSYDFMNSVGCLTEDCEFRLCEQCFDEIVDYEFKDYIPGPARYLYPSKPLAYLYKFFIDSQDN